MRRSSTRASVLAREGMLLMQDGRRRSSVAQEVQRLYRRSRWAEMMGRLHRELAPGRPFPSSEGEQGE